METVRCIIDVNGDASDWRKALGEGAQLLASGRLVAFPTETVYGLGANVWNAKACTRIFAVKGRPGDNPLIVHVASLHQVREVAGDWPVQAQLCAERFWPGPLTLVLPKNPAVPEVVTGGGTTVAVRIPSHPVALALLEQAQCPVAAPSANISGRPSPTLADHVWEDLAGKIPLIIDAGPCRVGVESTVLDLSRDKPVLLRPGGVPLEDLSDLLGKVVIAEDVEQMVEQKPGDTIKRTIDFPRSPGMKYRHYAPRGSVQILTGSLKERVDKIVAAVQKKKESLGLLCFQETVDLLTPGVLKEIDCLRIFPDNDGVHAGAAGLFAALRACDTNNISLILAEASEREQMGRAYMNRLERAGRG